MRYLVFIASLISAKTFTTVEYGPTFEISFENKTKRFKFLANVPKEQYLQIVFAAPSSSKTGKDLVEFSATGIGNVFDKYFKDET